MDFRTYKCPRCKHEEEYCFLDKTSVSPYPLWCYKCQGVGDAMVEMKPKEEETDANL